jgi:hypothetical protein
MAGCRLMWPNACRRWPCLAPRNRRTRAAAGVLRLITAGQVTGTVEAAYYRYGGHNGGEDNRRPRRRSRRRTGG